MCLLASLYSNHIPYTVAGIFVGLKFLLTLSLTTVGEKLNADFFPWCNCLPVELPSHTYQDFIRY